MSTEDSNTLTQRNVNITPSQQQSQQQQGDIACVFGASGACGRHLVDELLERPEIGQVYCFRRSKADKYNNNPKYKEVILTQDLQKDLENNFPSNCDVVFSGLATTIKQAGSQEVMKSIDYGMNDTIATYAHEQGVPQYYLISSVSADSQSRFFYMKMKGELEDRIKAIGFPRAVVLQPGILTGAERTGKDYRTGEWFIETFLVPIWCCTTGYFGAIHPIDVRDVGKVMALDYIENRSQNSAFKAFYQLNKQQQLLQQQQQQQQASDGAPYKKGGYNLIAGSMAILDELKRHQSLQESTLPPISTGNTTKIPSHKDSI